MVSEHAQKNVTPSIPVETDRLAGPGPTVGPGEYWNAIISSPVPIRMLPPSSAWRQSPAAAPPQTANVAEPPAASSVLFLIYLFLVFSRALEFTIQIPKLMLVLGGVSVLVVTVTSLNFSRLASWTGLLLAALTGIMFASTPFSYWRGGSAQILYGWLASLVVFLTGVQVLTTPRLLRRALLVIAGATLFLSVFAARAVDPEADRLGLIGSLGNPNDLAAVLLFALPCWLLIYTSARGQPLRKLLFGGVIAVQLFLVLRTGSRGALLTLFLLAGIGLIRLPGAKKILFLAAVVLFGIIGVAVMPEAVVERYRSYSTEWEPGGEAGPEEAVASARLRRTLMTEALKVTLTHPLLGVGPGQFMLAANEGLEKRGGRALWLASHNTYLQVSSELGIPALLIYLGILAHATRVSFRIARRGAKPLQPLGWCVFLMTISYCATSFFLTLAYYAFVPLLAALATSLDRLKLPAGAGTPVQPEVVPSSRLPALAPIGVAGPNRR